MSQNIATPSTPTMTPHTRPAWVGRVLRIEWLGQTAASLCWITSVFFYGITSTGDVLQLCAATAWLIANLAVAFAPRND